MSVSGASTWIDDPIEVRNAAYASVMPTTVAQINKIDENNMLQGLTMQNVYAAAFLDPVFATSNVIDSEARTSSRTPATPRPSLLEAWQNTQIQAIQDALIGAP